MPYVNGGRKHWIQKNRSVLPSFWTQFQRTHSVFPVQLQFAGYKESTVNLCPTPCQTFSRVLGAERSSWICKGRSWKTRNCRDELYFLCLPQLNELMNPPGFHQLPCVPQQSGTRTMSAKWFCYHTWYSIFTNLHYVEASGFLLKLRRVARLLACQRSSAEEAWGFVRNCSEKKRIEFTLRWKHWEDLGSVAKALHGIWFGHCVFLMFELGLVLIEELWRSFRSVGHGSLPFSHFHHAAGCTIWLSQKLVFELFWLMSYLPLYICIHTASYYHY